MYSAIETKQHKGDNSYIDANLYLKLSFHWTLKSWWVEKKKKKKNTHTHTYLNSNRIDNLAYFKAAFFKHHHRSIIDTGTWKRWKKILPLSHYSWRCPWCNGYRSRKWTRRHEFESWMRLIAFHIALIPLGKVWIQLFSLPLWVNSRVD